MAERLNGKAAFTRRTHGADRRGVFPVPSLGYVSGPNEQSKRDKQRVLDIIKQRRQERLAEQFPDLGNKELPAYKYKQEIIANVDAYKAIILGGETGSGKSTQIPQFLYEAGYDKIFVLVPRRVIADGLGERIREEMSSQIEGFEAEKSVGIVHGERSELDEENRIIVMTPNTYVRMEADIRRKYADKKVAIMPDEVHEANLFTEISIGTAAMGVQANEHWRIIAASATHNASTLQPAFQQLNGERYVPHITIEGRPFQVELVEEPNETPMEVYARMGADHQKSMLFTSGKKEIDHIINETIAALEKNASGSSKQVVFRKLHGELSEVELAHINDEIPEGYRLVIVSSPAGMSGITIPGVTLVVTDGTINRQELDEDGIPGLRRHYLSKAGVTQQIGRAGRDVPGGIGVLAKPTTVVEDMLKKRGSTIDMPQMPYISFGERAEHEPPEIYSSNLSRVVLSVAALDRRFSDINPYIPHSVKQTAIINAEESLSRLGALDEEDAITVTGRSMDMFPISPELSRGLHEVRTSGRSLQQLARAALLASAVEVGGLQDFAEKQEPTWRQLVRPTTSDDFIAQLDIMSALEEATRNGRPVFDFVETFTLHPKRVERAQKLARKILQSFRISPENIMITAPQPDEETQLRNDFTAGMIDLVYEEVGKSYRKTQYRNIHGDDTSTRRTLSDRTVSNPKRGQLIAGFPRWFEKQLRKGGVQHFDVVEMTLHVDPAVVGSHALANHLLVGRLTTPAVDGDRVVEREQMMFGSIPVGEIVTSVSREQIPEPTQKLIVRRALEVPGPKQRALREIAEELELYRQRTPEALLRELRLQHAPADITKETIQKLIEGFAVSTRSLSEIDDQLGQYTYSKNVTINRYFDDAARLELQERSPDMLMIGGEMTRVLYDNGEPYVTVLSRRQRAQMTAPLHLKDGREVLLQIARPGGGTVRVSIGSLEVE